MDFPKNRDEELEMVLGEDPKDLIVYMSIYIDSVLDIYDIEKNTKDYIRKKLIDSILVAKKRFLDNGGDKKDYKFSTYFSWYLNQELKNYSKK